MPTSASHAVIPRVIEGNSILASLPQQAIVQLAQASATAAIATSRIYQEQQPPTNATTLTKVKFHPLILNRILILELKVMLWLHSRLQVCKER